MHYENLMQGVGVWKRTLSDTDLATFFSVIDCPEHYLFFLLQFTLGLRIGECCQLKVDHFDWQESTVRVQTFKQRGAHTIFVSNVPKEVLALVQHFCASNALWIKKHGGWLFPSPIRPRWANGKPSDHVSRASMIHAFATYRQRAGLDLGTYTNKGGQVRHVVRSHTLRATSINRILRETGGDWVAAMTHSRHKSFVGFFPYVAEYNREEIRAVQEKAFGKIPVRNVGFVRLEPETTQ